MKSGSHARLLQRGPFLIQLVGFARRTFMVPRFASWDAFNLWLKEQCRKRQADVLRGYEEMIGQRLARDTDAMADLPAAPFDACDQAAGRVTSLDLVRYKTNDYPVPVAHRHRDVWILGYVHVVVTRLVELERIDRERRLIERRINAARFPAVKSLDGFDFKAIPGLNKMQVLELARCEWIERAENVIALGPSGTGKTHVALGLGLAACQKGLSVGFTTAATLVNELMEARNERRLLRLQKQMAGYKLLIIDELGFVPLSKTGAELLFEMTSQRYECGATQITSNLPFDEWTETFGSQRLTCALLDRLTHHVNILEMNGDSYQLGQSRARKDTAIN